MTMRQVGMMEGSVMKFYGTLESELEKAKENLKGVEESIKKIIGRDLNESSVIRPSIKRTAIEIENNFHGDGNKNQIGQHWKQNTQFNDFGRQRRVSTFRVPEQDARPSIKRRLGADPKTVFSRLSGPPTGKNDGNSGDEDEFTDKPVLSSRIIATPRDMPSRQEVMAQQGKDEQGKARNRRMFGALLGTLQKFRQEETRLKGREDKKALVEKKLEDAAKREKEDLRKERQELFQSRKRRQAEIRNLEFKMIRLKEQDVWEASQRHLLNFIQTRCKPHIFYLPKVHNPKTEERLSESKKVVTKMIEKKRTEIQLEIASVLNQSKEPNPEDINPDQDTNVAAEDIEMEEEIIGDKENDFGIQVVKVEKLDNSGEIVKLGIVSEVKEEKGAMVEQET